MKRKKVMVLKEIARFAVNRIQRKIVIEYMDAVEVEVREKYGTIISKLGITRQEILEAMKKIVSGSE